MRKGEVEVKKSLLEWKMENYFWEKKWEKKLKMSQSSKSL